MNLINALILGIVEGVTEFLPISSTAHLIITSKLLKIPTTEFIKFFEVFIQSGAILAVLLLYYSYVIKNKEIIKKIIVSFIPTAIIGFLLHKIIKTIFFESYYLIIGSLFFIGLLFIIFEYLVKNKRIKLVKSINRLDIYQAAIIGLIQSLAVIPGVSRAGAVMLGMMMFGYKRDEAALYSFLLAVPTILAASALDFVKTDFSIISNLNNLLFLIVGFVTSFLTAYFSIKWLIGYLQKKSLIVFGVYRVLTSFILYVL